MSYLIGYKFKNGTRLLQGFKQNQATISYSPQYNHSLHNIDVIQIDSGDYVFPKKCIKVNTNPSDNSLSVEFLERTRGQLITIFLFTLSGTLLKRIRTRKSLTIINNPSIFNNDFLMNIQINDSVYTWRIAVK